MVGVLCFCLILILQVYHSLDADGKKTMAKKYAGNGPKNLDSASSYIENTAHESIFEKGKNKRMRARNWKDTQGSCKSGSPCVFPQRVFRFGSDVLEKNL